MTGSLTWMPSPGQRDALASRDGPPGPELPGWPRLAARLPSGAGRGTSELEIPRVAVLRAFFGFPGGPLRAIRGSLGAPGLRAGSPGLGWGSAGASGFGLATASLGWILAGFWLWRLALAWLGLALHILP